jgi:hypothetical protein
MTQMKQLVGQAKKELLPERRDLTLQFILKQDQGKWMDWWIDCVKNNRIIFGSDLNA